MGCHVSCKIVTIHLLGSFLGALMIALAVYDVIFECLSHSFSMQIQCITASFIYAILGIFCMTCDVFAPTTMIKHFYFYFTYIGRSLAYFIISVPLITTINVLQIADVLTRLTSFVIFSKIQRNQLNC